MFCMFCYRLYQTNTKLFLFGHLKGISHMSELELFWVSSRGLPVDCLINHVPYILTDGPFSPLAKGGKYATNLCLT